MNIGAVIKELRRNKGIKQEELADTLQVSVQTVSRWENEVNYPDLSMLPQLSAFFQVTTDYLLGVERSNTMAKLLKTVETFEVNSKQEAEEMLLKFRGEQFPILKAHEIMEVEGKIILEVTKEFNADVDNMKFE